MLKPNALRVQRPRTVCPLYPNSPLAGSCMLHALVDSLVKLCPFTNLKTYHFLSYYATTKTLPEKSLYCFPMLLGLMS